MTYCGLGATPCFPFPDPLNCGQLSRVTYSPVKYANVLLPRVNVAFSEQQQNGTSVRRTSMEPTPTREGKRNRVATVPFARGSHALSVAAMQVIEATAALLKRESDAARVVSIVGRATSEWDHVKPGESADSNNRALANRRAIAVAEALRMRVPGLQTTSKIDLASDERSADIMYYA